ncbi:ABC transporter ATP-binding protein [Marinomonas transparens]|uniref:ABC transporter ATP-binding protein n=1 Tax=Marinomonas transparens TaxID=2795388 RepID=A0A934JVB2_9GAMM|nr:ABC transporter ATP-binding protein [Marinomonas transparens]MBJ7538952.1 ABC transporter ATP-binding protein [Marinomonas transparens]
MQANAIHSLKWLLRASKSEYCRLSLALLFTLLKVITGLIAPIMIYLIVEGMVTGSLTLPEAINWLVVCVVAMVVRYLLLFGAVLLSHAAAFALAADLKVEVSRKLLFLPMTFFSQAHSADLRRVMDEDIGKIELFISHHLNDVFTAVITPILTAFVLFYFSWPLAIIALLPLPVALLTQAIMFRGYSGKVKNYQKALVDMNVQASELIQGVSVLRMLSRSGTGLKKLNNSINNYVKVVDDWTRQASKPFAFFKVALDFSFILLLPVAAYLTIEGGINLAEFVVLMMLGLTLMEPFYNLLMFSGLLNHIFEGVQRIEQVQLAEELTFGTKKWPRQTPAIQLDNVSYQFPERDIPALNKVSLSIEAGEKIAIVGASGSGKSTLIQLMAGFNPPLSGQVKYNDCHLFDYDSDDLYQHIGCVMQSNYLFNQSIRDNITMGLTVADKDIWEALERAEARQFVSEKEGGLDFLLSGQHTRLSGGEQQRITIARALIKPANVYFFDEATRFFDPITERNILNNLFEALTEKTMVYVTHRLESAAFADRIVVMELGDVVATGTHEWLQQHCDVYQELQALSHSSGLQNKSTHKGAPHA